ncbi:biopolymer transport protein ExbB [Rubricella aquisinus]|uniref:Biopolymer transport protein ExbB n=1 Tax=Rubricella aquisinus TaxID=2028108 RepID=A0A840WNV1_9RHOB|nr:MotA/TolQ/ExbB proton channel family protein [Rubricella aquisinus]MBB5516301.1 biopolymer transport protein ExbB [Rubricella aquisinus]
MTDTASASLLALGGPALWVIFGLSVLTLAVILWKLWHFRSLGAWSDAGMIGRVAARARGVRASEMSAADQREEVTRVARAELAAARQGLRALELIATIAPLVGLLGTVLGMIDAFRVLEASGAQADPGALAGGIWEALLTTAAGMAVAIPASAALTWFDSIVDRLRLGMEDQATRILTGQADA